MKNQTNTKLLLLRILLSLLILANMALIFRFSHQDGTASGETSKQVTTVVAQTTIKDFEKKDEAEQTKIVTELNIPVRTLAHMAEFGALGALTLLLLLTWKRYPFVKYLAAVAFAFVYACIDEWHQKLVGGRAAQWIDIAYDTLGAAICAAMSMSASLST